MTTPATTVPEYPLTGAAEDRYAETLRKLVIADNTLHTAIFNAQLARNDAERRTGLVELHRQIRVMATLANDALGGWPRPADDAETAQESR